MTRCKVDSDKPNHFCWDASGGWQKYTICWGFSSY